MALLGRKHYPLFQKTELKFDVDKLREEMYALEEINGWDDMKKGSQLVESLITGRERLTKVFQNDDGEYHDYEQMIVTDFAGDKSDTDAIDGKISQYKEDIAKIHAGMDESNYNTFRDVMNAAPYTKSILEGLPDPIARVRYAKIKPDFQIKPHIDYDTKYGMRYHIALTTNDKCTLGFRRSPKDDYETIHIPTDGHLYFVNAGFEHYADNFGDEERIHLVIGLSGQSIMDPYIIK